MEYLKEEFGAGDLILDLLQGGGLLTESKASLIKSKADILEESTLLEARQDNPAVYTIAYKDYIREINWNDFWTIWNDISNFKTTRQLAGALNIDQKLLDETDKNRTRKIIRDMAVHFRKGYGSNHFIPVTMEDTAREGTGRNTYAGFGFKYLSDIPTTNERGILVPDVDVIADAMGYDNPDDIVAQASQKQPTRDDIDLGFRGQDNSRTGRIIDNLNKQEIFAGEFYSNMSRIKKSSLFNWLRFWKKDTVGLKAEGGFLSRKWKKVFVLGYQVDRNFLFEIWFNTIDSTFSLYDKNGAELNRRTKSLFETVKALFLQLAKTSPQDIDVLKGGVDRRVYDSFIRAMNTRVDDRVESLKDMEERERKALQKQAEKAQQQRDAFKKKIKDIGRGVFNIEPYEKQALDRDTIEYGRSDTAKNPKKWEKDTLDANASKAKQSISYGFDGIFGDLAGSAKKTSDAMDDIIEKSKKRQEKDAYKDRIKDVMNQAKGDKASTKPKQDKVYTTRKRPALKRVVNENVSDGDFDKFMDERQRAEFFAAEVNDELGGSKYDSKVHSIRKQAEKESVQFKKLRDTILSTIVKYDETRVGKYAPTLFDRIMNKGRKEKVVLPNDKPTLFNRIKGFFRGVRYRADFIIGYSLADRIDYEIWYVTEANPAYDPDSDPRTTISSFYVYDLTSGMILRRYIPYYRQAEQIVLMKIAAGSFNK